MQFIDVSKYDHETMQLAWPLYDKMRRVLLTAGRTIHPKMLARIKEMGISTLMVEDAESKGITMDEMVDMPTWLDTIEVVQKIYDQAKKKQEINMVELKKAVEKIITEVSARRTIFLIPSTYVTGELKDYAHSVNVALLSIQMGKTLHYSYPQLRDLAIGALLHDIGKVFATIETEHPLKGFDWMKSIREISLLSAHIAFQHHELLNGKGYPRGISENNVLDFPQVCAVANRYERLISSGTMLPHEAMELISMKHNLEYKGNIVEAFISSIPSYIPGTKVMLSNGQKAMIIGFKTNLHRPVIRYVETEVEVDLVENPSIVITGILEK